jgi:hypothetical protein
MQSGRIWCSSTTFSACLCDSWYVISKQSQCVRELILIFVMQQFLAASAARPALMICGTFCAFLWHILCLPVAHFVPSCGTFCAFLWHIVCLPVAHKSKSLFVPCCSTFCAFLWHISLKGFLCHVVAHFVQVKNCKKKSFRQFGQLESFFSRLNE